VVPCERLEARASRCVKSPIPVVRDYGPHETSNKWLLGATARKVVWVFLPLGNGNHLAYLPRKKKGSIHQTSSKFELHTTMPNRCSSFYSPIKQFALLFCALHSCFAQKTGVDSCSDVLCRKQKFTCSSRMKFKFTRREEG
jgi:hypothetical protein